MTVRHAARSCFMCPGMIAYDDSLLHNKLREKLVHVSGVLMRMALCTQVIKHQGRGLWWARQ